MAVVCINGFEMGLTHPGWLNQSQGGVGAGRDGVGLCFVQNGNLDATVRQGFAAGSDEVFIHQGLWMSSAAWGAGFFGPLTFLDIRGDSASTVHLALGVDSGGFLTLRRAARDGTLLATSDATVLSRRDLVLNGGPRVIIHDTTGVCVVKVNGVEWINYTGDTRNAGASTRPDGLGWYANNDWFRIDDLLVQDTTGASRNSWTGEIGIVGIRPAGNGANSGLLGSDGNSTDNYLLVDEAVPFNTTDYVGSGTVGAKDTYDMSAVGKTGVVVGVQAFAYAAKSDVGTRAFKHLLRSPGGSLSASSAAGLSTTYGMFIGPLWTAQADASAWTVADVDASEFGIEVA